MGLNVSSVFEAEVFVAVGKNKSTLILTPPFFFFGKNLHILWNGLPSLIWFVALRLSRWAGGKATLISALPDSWWVQLWKAIITLHVPNLGSLQEYPPWSSLSTPSILDYYFSQVLIIKALTHYERWATADIGLVFYFVVHTGAHCVICLFVLTSKMMKWHYKIVSHLHNSFLPSTLRRSKHYSTCCGLGARCIMNSIHAVFIKRV